MELQMPPVEEFERIIEASDRALWESYAASVGNVWTGNNVQIRFPRYRSGDIRVSEQEARFIVTGLLATSSLIYSVESPTSTQYQFTGACGVSGQTDVTVRAATGEGMWNMEFKAHGFSEERSKKLSIQKDIEKLLCEPLPAYWFHTFEGVDNSTLLSAWRAFVADVREVAQRLPAEHQISNAIVFHACILRHRFSIERKIFIEFGTDRAVVVENAPEPVYRVTRTALNSFDQVGGWRCRRAEIG